LLSIVVTVKHCCRKLRSCKDKFSILSDYRNLQYFMMTWRLCECQIQWVEELLYYNFIIKFRAG
jgi:hypothetical protein